jgi:hypothetical protein
LLAGAGAGEGVTELGEEVGVGKELVVAGVTL